MKFLKIRKNRPIITDKEQSGYEPAVIMAILIGGLIVVFSIVMFMVFLFFIKSMGGQSC
jgi:hypothetical protein